jgi:hypothetical protein
MKKYLLIVGLTFAVCGAHADCPSWPTSARFTFSGNTVTDQRTGLIWKRCSEGQGWSGTACIGTATLYTHEGALAQAQSQNLDASGNVHPSGWRLPNVKELFSLVDVGCFNSAIDVTAFPNMPTTRPGVTSIRFWATTPNVSYPNLAWFVDFLRGEALTTERDLTYQGAIDVRNPIRLVRDAPP